MRQNEKLICINDIYNVDGNILFKKDEIYTVLYVDNEQVSVLVCLDHILYGNEYASFDIQWVLENFINISTYRDNKINKIL